MQIKQSTKLFSLAQQRLPGGVNSPVRNFGRVGGQPVFMERGVGSKVYDVDGNEYIDYLGSWGPLILGHCNPVVVEALKKACERGMSFGTPTEAEIRLAEMVQMAFPSIELVRMVNSGTEATMSALRVARGYTGRDLVIKFEAGYHGHGDSFLIQAGSGASTFGIPDSPGVPADLAKMTINLPYNDTNAVRRILSERGEEIACVIVEPVAGNMGMIPPEHGFLQGLRDLCDREGILLIFDEVMTGFRIDFGGAQSLFGIVPDLSIFGKVIGGGLPVGAYGGRQDIMLQVAPSGPIYQAGTLSGNPLAVTAGLTTLEILKEQNPYPELGQKTAWLCEELTTAAETAGIQIQTQSIGGMFGYFFAENAVRNFQEALNSDTGKFTKFFQNMLKEGIYLPPSAFESLFISTAHSEEDLERTASAFRKALKD